MAREVDPQELAAALMAIEGWRHLTKLERRAFAELAAKATTHGAGALTDRERSQLRWLWKSLELLGAGPGAAPATRERSESARFFRGAGRFTELLGVRTPEGDFLVDTADLSVSLGLFCEGRRGDGALLRQGLALLRHLGLPEPGPEAALLDVGAHIGTLTVAALLSGFDRVLACEPAPGNFRLLEMNVELNGLSGRVEAYNAALSDADGTAVLRLDPFNSGNHRVAVAGDGTVSVPRTRLDSLPSDLLERLAIGWIDVQGSEGQLLAGAASLTSRGVPLIIEVYPLQLEEMGGTELLLAALAGGYTSFADMRGFRERDPESARVRPVAELPALIEELGDGFTDLLVVRA